MYVLNGFEVFDYLGYARVILIDWLINKPTFGKWFLSLCLKLLYFDNMTKHKMNKQLHPYFIKKR